MQIFEIFQRAMQGPTQHSNSYWTDSNNLGVKVQVVGVDYRQSGLLGDSKITFKVVEGYLTEADAYDLIGASAISSSLFVFNTITQTGSFIDSHCEFNIGQFINPQIN